MDDNKKLEDIRSIFQPDYRKCEWDEVHCYNCSYGCKDELCTLRSGCYYTPVRQEIDGYICRSRQGMITLHKDKPVKDDIDGVFYNGIRIPEWIDDINLKELTWENSPKKIHIFMPEFIVEKDELPSFNEEH